MEGTFTTTRRLPVQPVDTSGRVLALLCAPTDHVAVATKLVQVTPAGTSLGVIVRLDVLAASHRVRVGLVGGLTPMGQDLASASRDADLWELHETVACAGAREQSIGPRGDDTEQCPAGELPSEHRWQSRNFQAHFQSQLTTGEAAIHAAVGRIRAIEDRPDALVGEFPGHESALTALCVRNDAPDQHPVTARSSFGWDTWHLYPGHDPHVVTTTTTLRTTRPGDLTTRVREDIPR